MGRTDPTYRDLVRATERRWADYRRALRRADRPHFDRLFEHARAHADAAGYCNHATPEVSILLSIALEHEAAIDERAAAVDEQRAAIADHERRLVALENRVGSGPPDESASSAETDPAGAGSPDGSGGDPVAGAGSPDGSGGDRDEGSAAGYPDRGGG